MAVPVSSVEASALRGAMHRDGRASRRDARHAVVRLVELVPFPRVRADRAVAVGFTRDISERGMCLLSERPEGVCCVRNGIGKMRRPAASLFRPSGWIRV